MQASGSRKRLFADVSSIDCAVSDAMIHDVITSLSPVKKAKKSESKYFKAQLTDGKKEINVVGFLEKQHSQLEQLCKEKDAIEIAKCAIKPSLADPNQLEVLLNSYTQLTKSPSKFELPQSMLDGETCHYTLDKISSLRNSDPVTTTVKVVKVERPTTVTTGKTKQDTVIADSTGTLRLTLWEGDVDKLDEGKSYKLVNMLVRCYKGCNYLSFPTDGSAHETTDVDTGSIDTESSIQHEPQKRTFEIIGVSKLALYASCIACKSKVDTITNTIGKCSKCNLTQKLAHCSEEHIAKLHLQQFGADDNTPPTVANAFAKAIGAITGAPSETPTEAALLDSPPFACTITNNIISAVYRDTTE